jgi:hypothetical protein
MDKVKSARGRTKTRVGRRRGGGGDSGRALRWRGVMAARGTGYSAPMMSYVMRAAGGW